MELNSIRTADIDVLTNMATERQAGEIFQFGNVKGNWIVTASSKILFVYRSSMNSVQSHISGRYTYISITFSFINKYNEIRNVCS